MDGSEWTYYTEYYQWRPPHNKNSKSYSAKGGQTLHGSLIYDSKSDSYFLNQTLLETGVSSTQTVPCQNGKKYRIPYVVYEKTFPCSTYPPDGVVTFKDIYAECDNTDCTSDIKWEAKVKDPNCDMKANIIDTKTISITWDPNAKSKYDNMKKNELIHMNALGWAKNFIAQTVQENDSPVSYLSFHHPTSLDANPQNPMVVSPEGQDNALLVQLTTPANQDEIRSIDFKLVSRDDGYVGAHTNKFLYSTIYYQTWVANVKFDKKAPFGTYYASVTVTQRDGTSKTIDDFENTYWNHERNQYAIQYVPSHKDIVASDIQLTSLEFPESVAWSDNQFTFKVGFESPVGLYHGRVQICPLGETANCDHGYTSLLCTDKYSTSSGIEKIQLDHEDSHQVEGNFLEGIYESTCVFQKDYNKPGKYEFAIILVNNARREHAFKPDDIVSKGFKSIVTITDD